MYMSSIISNIAWHKIIIFIHTFYTVLYVYYLYEILEYLRVYFFLLTEIVSICVSKTFPVPRIPWRKRRVKETFSHETRKKVKMKFVELCLRLTQVKENHNG